MILPTASTLCNVFTFLLAGSPIFYSAAPRGSCSSCCTIREREDIKFLLYTRKNRNAPQQLQLSDEARLARSNFNFNYPLAIYLHGFSESATGDKQSSQQLKDAFLRRGNYNVILVDWSAMVTVPWYSNAVENLPVTARYLARFLRYLVTSGYAVKHIHLIGFSLGAEVAGFAGKQLQEWGIKLTRITALDPALPLFEGNSSNRRLSPKDARFVDVIHTDGGILGNPTAMGHADFYPNGGRPLQPGCARQEIANNRWLNIIIGCSHQRAWEYFEESIQQPLAFPSERCEPSQNVANCGTGYERAYMGYGADPRLRGKFYLETNDAKPFGRHRQSPGAASTAPQLPISYKMPVNTTRDLQEDDNNMLSNNIALT
ncbi:pancreatic lipase-related protein 2 [Drosophila sulfurigaster albostrigata]|uniref:pancreatic lipase-related protein 2 n=1 Tax=Drosophila sulfurigaster albostrigata TaxID=89887 RepID=UPI002D21881B|nr:pancreatic lipase-related protein 2 [Drosophila sulfurigaster albostrigata]